LSSELKSYRNRHAHIRNINPNQIALLSSMIVGESVASSLPIAECELPESGADFPLTSSANPYTAVGYMELR
jgi:hypothetical protein